jgi:hypothetical protein
MSALMVPAPIRIAIVEPTSTRLRNRERSSSGSWTRRSTATKPKPAATETTRQPIVPTEAQPQSLPLLRARISGASVRATRTVPA